MNGKEYLDYEGLSRFLERFKEMMAGVPSVVFEPIEETETEDEE